MPAKYPKHFSTMKSDVSKRIIHFCGCYAEAPFVVSSELETICVQSFRMKCIYAKKGAIKIANINVVQHISNMLNSVTSHRFQVMNVYFVVGRWDQMSKCIQNKGPSLKRT